MYHASEGAPDKEQQEHDAKEEKRLDSQQKHEPGIGMVGHKQAPVSFEHTGAVKERAF